MKLLNRYISKRLKNRIRNFVIIGGLAAIVNLGTMIFFVEVFGFKGYYQKNAANIITMEISIIFNFIFQRQWTWKEAPKKHGKGLFLQFCMFNGSAIAGVLMRTVLFAILEFLGVFYLINVTFGIIAAATLDFILYDKIVFKRGEYGRDNV